MRTFKRMTFILAAIAPLALSACATMSTSGTVGAAEQSGSTVSVPTATDAQQSGSAMAPGNYGNVFVGSPEPGFNPDTIQEAP